MTIHYANGTIQEAVILREDESSLRLAVRGLSDVLELRRINHEFWATPDCEAVRVKFGAPAPAAAAFDELDFICPPELAAKLMASGSEPVPIPPRICDPFEGAVLLPLQ